MTKKTGILIIPGILFIAVFISDFWRFTGIRLTVLPDLWREWFIGIALLILVLDLVLFKPEKDADLLRHLRRWVGKVIGLFIVMILFKRGLPFVPNNGPLIRLSATVTRWLLLIITADTFYRIMLVFKSLIFLRQKKNTARNYRLLLLMIGLYLIVVLLFGIDHEEIGVWPSGNAWKHLIFSVLLLFAFINGRRTDWIHYLNKKQKIRTLLWGMGMMPFSALLMMRLPGVLGQYSEVAGAFALCMTWVNLIGSGLVVLSILSHLPSAGILDRRMQEIRSLQDLSSAMSSIFERDKLLAKITEMSLQLVDADAAWIELKSGKAFEPAAFQHIQKKEILQMPGPVHQILQDMVMAQSKPILLNDPARDKRIEEIKRWTKKAGSLLATKIACKNQCTGILYALKTEPFGFEEECGGLFQAFADQAAISIENARLVQLSFEQERYREELRLAHDAQRRLLPQKMPDVRGVELDGFSLTANDIGGDFYDVFQIHPDRIDIVVGDVSGSGASAAFYMAELHGSIQTISRHFASPKEIVKEINSFLIQHEDPENFVTLLYASYQPTRKRIRMVRAGHQPVGYLSKRKFKWIEPKGLGLGMVSSDKLGKILEEKSMMLNPGDTLFFYTDGLIEVRNGQGKEFDEAALAKILVEFNGKHAKDLLSGILRHVEQFSKGQPRTDDMTAVVLRIQEKK